MPNRIIKESICTSDSIDKLSAFEETFFYRLIVNCDDYGRMDARPRVLAARLFPLKSIRDQQIMDALRTLTSAELVTLYNVGGKPFLKMNTWDRHQQIRAKKSKYPAPPGGPAPGSPSSGIKKQSDETESGKPDIICNQMISDDINGKQLTANVPVIQSNPIQSESNPNPHANARAREPKPDPEPDWTSTGMERDFEKFWAAYPLHKSRAKAHDEYFRIAPDDKLLETIILAIQRQKKWRHWREGYIPAPARWLREERWTDEEEPELTQESGTKRVSAQMYHQREYDNAEMEKTLGVFDIYREAAE